MASTQPTPAVAQCVDLCAGYVRKREKNSSNPNLLFRLLEIRQAVGPVSHTVRSGQLTGVIGDNGAGKSTFLKALASSLPLLSGELIYNEEPASIIELGSPRSQWMTGREYVREYFQLSVLMRILREAPDDLCREAERFAGIGSAFDRPLATYSSGMQARLLFAAAFAGSTPYVLLDELLSVGDGAFTAKCWRLIQQKLLQGMGGFLVTHDWSSVLRLCSHCIWLDHGVVRLDGSPQTVISSYLGQGAAGQQFILDNLRMTGYEYDAVAARLTLSFGFSKLTNESLQAAVSIEDIGQGRGWQILALTDFQHLSDANQNNVTLKLEPLPLMTGNYEVCLFIKGSNPTSELSCTYSWYTDSSFPIQVEGLPSFLASN